MLRDYIVVLFISIIAFFVGNFLFGFEIFLIKGGDRKSFACRLEPPNTLPDGAPHQALFRAPPLQCGRPLRTSPAPWRSVAQRVTFRW